MHVVNCEHPVKIFNKYSNEFMYVRCGKCNTCRNARAYKWVKRLEQERSCHPFTMFIYLDYDNENIPKYDLSFNPFTGEKFLSDSRYTFNDSLFNDLCIPFDELKFADTYDKDYFDGRLNHPLRIPHGSVRDIQLFLKRFNKYCYDKISKTYRNFRYFIVQEYGPTTFRPHYHGLMFIDNQKVADAFREILSHSWRFGHSDYKLVESSASSYVAQYLNCDTHLPSFYAHPKLRPFFLCSRKPPIGSLLESDEEVQKIFDTASPVRVCRTSLASNSLSVVPLLPSFKDRLFPKCPRFGSLTHPLRVALYGLADASKGEFSENFESWLEYIKERCFPAFPLDGDWFNVSSFVRSESCYCHSDVAKYLCFISDNFGNERPLRELFRISNRVLAQCSVFHVSLDRYVTQIELFYNNLELMKLRDFYQSQINMLADGNVIVDDLVHMYPLYYENVKNSLSLDLDICDVPDYQKMITLASSIAKENTKVSRKNAYFEGRLKNTDPKLQTIIKNFYYGKKCYENAQTIS